ncbi:MAG: 2-C-methyl-D-erythritol 2,4-cyclodiphosphate synthase [SAR116 cluster bacterium]|nr:2-C-methyl-D-erythritol 2,4-cyclodiphosphate synthase [SAR116 cluster bacterium]
MITKKFNAILLAAGKGNRFGSEIPKQFLSFGNKKVLDICIDQISSHKFCHELIVVVDKNFKKFKKFNKVSKSKIKIVIGGQKRQDSLINGLKNISDKNNLLLIHDAARPGIDHEIINSLLKKLNTNEVSCVIPILPLYDSIIRIDKNTYKSIKRENFFRIQTPQIFTPNALTFDDFIHFPNATDESEILVNKNKRIKTIPGKEKLLKITTKWDYQVFMQKFNDNKEYRTGSGFDVHSFTKTKSKLFLGGIEIEYKYGLEGHSDADVLLHSITDAILGAISKGDIGIHFPPNEKKWENQRSSIFLKKALDLLKEANGELINIDTTIICEEPKISKYNEKLINNLCKLTNISPDRISVKATTTEKLGFLGRKEGIAAMTSVMVKL